jgi:hypothetical protein
MSSSTLSVRPILSHERARFDETLAAEHWLGTGLVNEVMRYVAEENGSWVALVGFGSAALCVRPREGLERSAALPETASPDQRSEVRVS